MGMEYADNFTLRPKPVNNHAPVVVPILAPNIIPIPPAKSINPAERKEMVKIESSELDCINVVVIIPKFSAYHNRLVEERKNRSNIPPDNC